jgi:hypothetical protein
MGRGSESGAGARRALQDARANNLTNHKNGEGKQRDNSGVRPSVGVLG